jgi:Tol biopolymer transport system component
VGGRDALRRFLSGIAVLATFVVLCIPPRLVGATAPGHNGLISYRRYFNDEHTSGALFVANPDGSHETQITFPAANQLDYTQNWSPDGSQLAFERDTFMSHSETSEIWVVNADGSNPHRLFPCPGDDVCGGAHLASWSPDGQWIAFSLATGPVTHHQSADVSIWAIHPDGTGLRQITHPIGFQRSEDFDPQWSPDGTRIVFERRLARRDWKPAVFTADSTDGSDVMRVSPKGQSAGDSPDWSPNGRWIIYRNDEAPGTQKVFLSHPDGSGFRVIIDGGGEFSFTSSSFSPDGTRMTIGIYPGVGKKGNADVWIGHFDDHMHIDRLKPLTRTHRWESSPRWGTAPLLG